MSDYMPRIADQEVNERLSRVAMQGGYGYTFIQEFETLPDVFTSAEAKKVGASDRNLQRARTSQSS